MELSGVDIYGNTRRLDRVVSQSSLITHLITTMTFMYHMYRRHSIDDKGVDLRSSALVGLNPFYVTQKYDSSTNDDLSIPLVIATCTINYINTMSRPSPAMLRPLIASSSRTIPRSNAIARYALPVASRGITTSIRSSGMMTATPLRRPSLTPQRQGQQRKLIIPGRERADV